jgi:DNA-binding Lrp family transcriptional regulator
MLTLEPDVGRAPLEEIKKIVGVIETHMLYGPYDGYVLIEAKNSWQIQDIVIKKNTHARALDLGYFFE